MPHPRHAPAAQPLPADYPLLALYSELYEPLKLRAASPNTRRLYGCTLSSFARFLGRPATLADLSDQTVSAYLLALHRQRLSPYTVAKQRWQLLALWRWAVQKGYVTNWPDVSPEPLPERIPQAWSRADLARLFAAIRQAPGSIAGVPAADWWETLHLVLWDTGERISAVIGLEWRDLDLARGYVLCRAENRKGRRRDRLYPLAADTIAALKKLSRVGEYVFPWPYCLSYLWDRYNRLLSRAGLPTNRASKFHRMRRSVASHAKAAGLDATELLDHADPRTTRAYIDPTIVQTPHVATHLFRPSDG